MQPAKPEVKREWLVPDAVRPGARGVYRRHMLDFERWSSVNAEAELEAGKREVREWLAATARAGSDRIDLLKQRLLANRWERTV